MLAFVYSRFTDLLGSRLKEARLQYLKKDKDQRKVQKTKTDWHIRTLHLWFPLLFIILHMNLTSSLYIKMLKLTTTVICICFLIIPQYFYSRFWMQTLLTMLYYFYMNLLVLKDLNTSCTAACLYPWKLFNLTISRETIQATVKSWNIFLFSRLNKFNKIKWNENNKSCNPLSTLFESAVSQSLWDCRPV